MKFIVTLAVIFGSSLAYAERIRPDCDKKTTRQEAVELAVKVNRDSPEGKQHWLDFITNTAEAKVICISWAYVDMFREEHGRFPVAAWRSRLYLTNLGFRVIEKKHACLQSSPQNTRWN